MIMELNRFVKCCSLALGPQLLNYLYEVFKSKTFNERAENQLAPLLPYEMG